MVVRADDIRWTTEPVRVPDLLQLSDEDLFVAAFAEGMAYRELAQQAIHALHDLSFRYRRLQAKYRRACEALRAQRQKAAT